MTIDYTLLLTTECQLKCSYCHQKGKPFSRMTTQQLKNILETHFEYRSQTSLTLSGGEPLLAVDLLKENEELLKQYPRLVLCTNGKDLQKHRQFLETFENLHIVVSIDNGLEQKYFDTPQTMPPLKNLQGVVIVISPEVINKLSDIIIEWGHNSLTRSYPYHIWAQPQSSFDWLKEDSFTEALVQQLVEINVEIINYPALAKIIDGYNTVLFGLAPRKVFDAGMYICSDVLWFVPEGVVPTPPIRKIACLNCPMRYYGSDFRCAHNIKDPILQVAISKRSTTCVLVKVYQEAFARLNNIQQQALRRIYENYYCSH